jgi:UDP-N-acetylglucosamine acyltransferase
VNIHPLACVSSLARIGHDVTIGPFSVVEDDVELGDGCRLEGHVVIKSGTTLGPENLVHEGAVLGGLPQHLHRPERPGRLVIGACNTIREHVTIHRSLYADQATVVGDHNLLMVNVHVAHDCRLGDHGIFANNVMLAGHVTIEDRAYISGAVGIHQFCRIGGLSMIGGQARVVKDVPPFVTLDGHTSLVVGLNAIGLRRNGFDAAQIAQLKAAYRLIFRSGLPWSDMLLKLQRDFTDGPAARFHEFFVGGQRGFVHERRAPPSATIRLSLADDLETRQVG